MRTEFGGKRFGKSTKYQPNPLNPGRVGLGGWETGPVLFQQAKNTFAASGDYPKHSGWVLHLDHQVGLAQHVEKRDRHDLHRPGVSWVASELAPNCPRIGPWAVERVAWNRALVVRRWV